MVKLQENLQNANSEIFEVSKSDFEMIEAIKMVFEKHEYNGFFVSLSLFYTDMIVCQATGATPYLVEDQALTISRLLNFLSIMDSINTTE